MRLSTFSALCRDLEHVVQSFVDVQRIILKIYSVLLSRIYCRIMQNFLSHWHHVRRSVGVWGVLTVYGGVLCGMGMCNGCLGWEGSGCME